MSGLILEIQHGALDKSTAVSDLLRKALAASKKLDIDEVVAWIEKELDGYKLLADLPDYRKLRGRIHVFNPYQGYQLLHMPKKWADTVEKFNVFDSVARLESVVAGNSDGTVTYSLDAAVANAIMKGMEVPLTPSLHVPVGSLVGVLDKVRNHILTWALDLEKKGVKGDGLSFTPTEVQAASQISYVTNIGAMHNSQFQQNSSGTQTYNSDKSAPLLDVMVELIQRLTELPELVREEVRADAETVIAQVNSPKPKASIMSEAVKSLRAVLENAAGGVLSSDMLPRLVKAASDCGFN
ncbi:hypothetical protein [Lysobacter capsici]|uniref:AbiTii domain-containing protein n=1 Tax=Lysobacter capsici TaxID=435897 RepID=UPI0004523CBA|nr:hypothetical protein [Lysobacter capsici]